MALNRKVRKGRERGSERMPDLGFRLMSLIMDAVTVIRPTFIDERVKTFGIRPGMTVVDYGRGPGRYTLRLSKLAGDRGKVYAVDIHELAIAAVKEKGAQLGLRNIEPVLVQGYSTPLPDHVADVVCALDMSFMVKDPAELLGELRRILAVDGTLVIDDGHQPRAVTRQKILASGLWTIIEETDDHLKCKPARA